MPYDDFHDDDAWQRGVRDKILLPGFYEGRIDGRFVLLDKGRLPTRPPKRATLADQRWPHDIAAELDASPPDTLRDMVRRAIERHLPADQLAHLQSIEREERATLMHFIGRDAA